MLRFLGVAVASAALLACSHAPPDTKETAHAHEDWNACATCHMPDYQRAKHHVGEKPITCGVCHSQEHWHPQIANHPWPLTGKHEKTKCFDCHKADAPYAKRLDKACVACHKAEYERAPHHVEEFPTTCAQCHTTEAWKPLVPNPVWPAKPAPPPPEPEPSASASAAPSASAPPPKPKPRWNPPPPKPTPTIKPPPPKPDPTSGASRRE